MENFKIPLITAAISAFLFYFFVEMELIIHVGFMGCTSYFVCNQGLRTCLASTLSGALWAGACLYASSFFTDILIISLLAGALAFFISIQIRLPLLANIPSAFIGASAAFSRTEEAYTVLISLIVGILFGLVMSKAPNLSSSFRKKT